MITIGKKKRDLERKRERERERERERSPKLCRERIEVWNYDSTNLCN